MGALGGTGRSLGALGGFPGAGLTHASPPRSPVPPPRRSTRPHPLVTHVSWAVGHSAAELAGLAVPKQVSSPLLRAPPSTLCGTPRRRTRECAQ
jgi:hypothetical protein